MDDTYTLAETVFKSTNDVTEMVEQKAAATVVRMVRDRRGVDLILDMLQLPDPREPRKMSDIEVRSDMTVELIDSMGSDESVVRAARISTGRDKSNLVPKEGTTQDEAATGLINFLMSNRHGTPFEHNAMTFRIEAPIFVWREFHRHRIGFSYNEESSRYKQLSPMFYAPAADRNLTQVGKPGHYVFTPGTDEQKLHTAQALSESYKVAYDAYEELLQAGIAREVARACLPVSIYSSCYVTCNARSLMSFLSLRTKREDSKFPSFPQREIELVAEQMEGIWAKLMPVTHAAFDASGRVSP